MIQFDLRIFFKWVGEKPPTSSIIYPTKQGRGWPITFQSRRATQDGSGEIGELWIAGLQVGLGYLRCQTSNFATFFAPKIWWEWHGFGDGETGLWEQKWRKQDDVASLHFFLWWFLSWLLLYPSKQARLDCYWCNLRRFANLCQTNLQQRLDRDVQVYICLESFSCFTFFFPNQFI